MIEAVVVGPVQKHPFADKLSITYVHGNPTVFRTGDFTEGSIAAYVPNGTVVNGTKCSAFKWLCTNDHVVESKTIRWMRSVGFLEFAPWDSEVGDDLTAHYRAEEARARSTFGQNVAISLALFVIVFMCCWAVTGR